MFSFYASRGAWYVSDFQVYNFQLGQSAKFLFSTTRTFTFFYVICNEKVTNDDFCAVMMRAFLLIKPN